MCIRDRSSIICKLINGSACQLMLINENSLCSILFHLLVPGGKWHTLTSNPVSLANCCNSVFHNLLRELLLPPPSAVISIFFAAPNFSFPYPSHQFLTVATAKPAVS